jgi:hypothetical protein
MKENKISIEDTKSGVSLSAIQKMLGIYHGVMLQSLDTVLNANEVYTIILLRQKTADKKKLAKVRRLGPNELQIYNKIAARGDYDTNAYNERIHKPYLSKYVNRGLNMVDGKYRMPEIIVPNYISCDKVKQMIYNKCKKGYFNIKSPKELEKLVKVAENVFNSFEDPAGAFNTVSADRTRDFSKKLYDIANDITPEKYADILSENNAIENAIDTEAPLPGEEEDDESGNESNITQKKLLYEKKPAYPTSLHLIWFDEIRPWFSLKINGIGQEIYTHCIGNTISYTAISMRRKEMELVAKGENVKDYISNNVNVTEIKWDSFGDNLSVPYEDFYKFINKKQYIFLFHKNAFLDDVAKKTTNIFINNL